MQVCLAIALVLRVAYWRLTPEWTFAPAALRWPDERLYYTLSRAIADEGLGFFLSDDRSTWVGNGNLIYLWLFRGSVLGPKVFNVFLSVVTVGLAYEVARRLSGSLLTARVAGALAAVSPLLIELSPTVLTEPPAAFTLALWLYASLRSLEGGSRRRWNVIGGLALGIGTLFRPTYLLLAPSTAAAILLWRRLQYGSWSSAAVRVMAWQTLVVFLICFPFMAKNRHLHAGFSVANGFGTAMFLGARGDTLGDEPPLMRKTYDTDKVCPGVHLSTQCDRILMARARELIREAPLRYIANIPAKVFRLWIGNHLAYFFPGAGVVSGSRFHPAHTVAWGMLRVLHATVLVVFSVLAVVWPGALRSEQRTLAALAVAYITSIHALSFAIPRYSYSFAPILAALAADGISRTMPSSSLLENTSATLLALRRVCWFTVVVIAAAVALGWEVPQGG